MDIRFFLAGAIIFFASFTQGMTGFGFALVSIPLLTLLIDIKHAIPLGALCGLAINIYLVTQLKNHIKFSEVRNLILGSIVGIPMGVFFLSKADPGILKMLLGIFIFLFVILSLTNFIRQKEINRNWGYIFGLLSGLFGGAFNTNGPPVLIYFYLQGWDKFKQKASITGFFVISSIIIVLSYTVTGLANSEVYFDFLKLFPFLLIGMLLGNFLFDKVSTKIYNKLILFGLLIISAMMIFQL